MEDKYFEIDGGWGQRLEVYHDYVVIETSSKFDANLVAINYTSTLQSMTPSKGILDREEIKDAFVNGIVNGSGIIRTGLRIGVSAGVDGVKTFLGLSKREFSVEIGKRKVFFSDYDIYDYLLVGNHGVGFIRFRKTEFIDNPANDIIFFFGGLNIFARYGLNKKMKPVCEQIELDFNSIEKKKKIDSENSDLINNIDKFDEIKKYKQLFDSGIITEEEFNLKKKELLRL